MASGTMTESLRETIGVFGEEGEPLTTSEVAESLGIGRRSTYDRLAVKLHHVDLPLMADLGLLDYDAERSAIEAIRVPADLVGR